MDKTTVMVEFVIRGDDFDPQVITDRLNIEPTRCWGKNTNDKPEMKKLPEDAVRVKDPELKAIFKRINERNKENPKQRVNRPRWFSLWQIDTGYEESYDIDSQIIKIYRLLKDKVQILNELKDEYSLEYTLGIVPQIENNEKPGMGFEKYIIDFVHDIKATIDIDLYIYS